MSKCQSRANWHALTFNRDGNERDEIYEKKLNAFSSTFRPKISHEKVLIEQTKRLLIVQWWKNTWFVINY